MSIAVNSEISPALHPAVIEGAESDPVLQQVQHAFQANYTDLASVHNARLAATNNPLLTKEAATLKVSAMAEKVQVKINKRFDHAASLLQGSIEGLNAQLAQPIADTSPGGVSAEIRAHVKAMNFEERSKFLHQAVAEQDLQTLRAVLGSPAYLSGMDKSTQAAFTHQFNSRRDPQTVARLERLRKAEMRLNAVGVIHTQLEKAIGATWAEIGNLKSQQRKLDQAFDA